MTAQECLSLPDVITPEIVFARRKTRQGMKDIEDVEYHPRPKSAVLYS
jgi:hypothetical protein